MIPRQDTEEARPNIDKYGNTGLPSLKFESGLKNKILIRYINPYEGNLNAIGLK
jgi:hypothetical protein